MALYSICMSPERGAKFNLQVSMSSTSIVVKCLTDAKATNTQHGQITIGTLILQDCMVGLLFAFMPVLANNRSADPGDSFEVLRLLTRYRILSTFTPRCCLLGIEAEFVQ